VNGRRRMGLLRAGLLGLALAAVGAAPLAAPADEAKTLLCLGDSLTAGYGLDESQAWPALLQGRLDRDLPGWRVLNAGVSGDTSDDALQRLAWILKSPPTAAFICLGANDGLRGLPPRRTEKNLGLILARLRAAGTVCFLAGMDLPTNLGPEYRAAFKAVFPRAAARAHAGFLPFLLEGVAGVPALNQADGIHPTAEGQAIVARHVAGFLLPRLAGLRAQGPAAAPARVLRRRKDLQ
jgi:acyl-CoA thioesterase-1